MKTFIEKTNTKKASQKSDMSTNILKKCSFYCQVQLSIKYINILIRSWKFHSHLKEADIVPVHKKGQKFLKKFIDLYKSIFQKLWKYLGEYFLPNISKVSGRCLYNQISIFFKGVFLKYQCNFSKG